MTSALTSGGGDYGGGGDSGNTMATEQASATVSAAPLGGGEYEYTVTLKNTGTTNLETFWYAWVPKQDYMPVSPTNIQSPANWTANITGGGSNNGFAIQWLTSSSATPAPLAPGGSLSFRFDSTVTPDVLAGNSPFYPGTPIGTSFVYGGAPLSDAGFQFVVTSQILPTTPTTPAVVSVIATIPKVVVGNGHGTIKITRAGDLSEDLKVSYTIKGDAVNGDDYHLLSGVAEINAGSASAVIKIKPRNNDEADEKTVKLVLEDGDGYTVGSGRTAKVKIVAAGH